MVIRYAFRALLLGMMVFALFNVNEWVINRVGPLVHTAFEQSGGCSMQVDATTCTLLWPSITFCNVVVEPRANQSWRWTADRYTISFSWIHLMLHGLIDMHISIDGLRAQSMVRERTPAIIDHIRCLTSGQSYVIPTAINSLALINAHLLVHDQHTDYAYSGAFNGLLARSDTGMKASILLQDGEIQETKTKKKIVIAKQHTVTCDIPLDGNLNALSGSIQGMVQSPSLLPELPEVHIRGAWNKQEGTLSLSTDDKTLVFDGTHITYANDCWCADIVGTSSLPHHHKIARDVSCSGKLWLSAGRSQFTGMLSSHYYGSFEGMYTWDHNKGVATIECNNSTPYMGPGLSRWQIEPGDLSIHVTGTKETATLNATGMITHTHNKTQQKISCAMTIAHGLFDVLMQCAHGTLECAGTYVPSIAITRATCKDVRGNEVIKACTRDNHSKRIHAQIAMDFLRTMAKNKLGCDIQGDGVCTADIQLGNTIAARIRLQNSSIRLPGIYNFIQAADCLCVYDSVQSTFTIKQGIVHLDRGTIRTDGAKILFDNNGQPSFAFMPLLVHKCMVTLERGIFALLSGSLEMQWQAKVPMQVKGHVFIDQAHIEGNIFSRLFQQSVATSARDFFVREYADKCVCDITCESIDHIRINTAFVETHAALAMHIVGMASKPAITGTITLNGGTFFFPYKPLYITRGTIYFDEQQPHDSLIEVVASNKIKKYTVNMQISGSLQHNTVHLFSSPSLSEEQILSLLLIGSQEESLNIVMPALIMQNLSGLIFNQSQSSIELESFFGRLLKPFEHIRFIPSFADQSGRGGLRGAIEIEINDRLRTMIQKNFSLLEDTRFEVEYAVSDDVVVRGMRNERRDVGAEVELRWKF